MRKQIIVLAVGALLAQTGWTREKSDDPKAHPEKEQSIGLGSGAAIGALAGGPVGLIIGAAMGGWLGDRFHHERGGAMEVRDMKGDPSIWEKLSWNELSGTEQQLWRELGWTPVLWDRNQAPPSTNKEWAQLTPREQAAASGLGFTEDIWNGFEDQ